ncbi:GAF domain-containing protein [Paenibacillus spiritus]|uniref:GAF domain-containing protein n=1 Tax=Paenibacillus spiritus TaxID=2496557 RepID=A0A5J5FWQ5_9BACL|nr:MULTISPECIES: GAF domain-containing protein [Paenibacillus]KAA8998371.1 GAF domain-containing protein [Paenibacillus spiritus]
MDKEADLQRELEHLRGALGYDFMAIALPEPAEEQFVIKWRYAAGNLNERYRRIVLQTGKGVAGIVFKTGKPMWLPSVQEAISDENLFHYPIINLEKLKSLAAVPLWNDARVAGVLLGGFREPERVTESHLEEMLKWAKKGIGDFNGKEWMSN